LLVHVETITARQIDQSWRRTILIGSSTIVLLGVGAFAFDDGWRWASLALVAFLAFVVVRCALGVPRAKAFLALVDARAAAVTPTAV
jgi:hypothetical protein